MSLVAGGMRFEDQELSWEGWCSVQQIAEFRVRSFLKSSCLIPFVWFQIIPGVLIYLWVKIIIFKACPSHGLHLSSPWRQKICLALEVYFLSAFFGDEKKHICVVAALRISIWFQCRELQHHFLHVATVGVEMQCCWRLQLPGKKNQLSTQVFFCSLAHFTHVEGCVSQPHGFCLYNELKYVIQYHFLNLSLTSLWVLLCENWTEMLHCVVNYYF